METEGELILRPLLVVFVLPRKPHTLHNRLLTNFLPGGKARFLQFEPGQTLNRAGLCIEERNYHPVPQQLFESLTVRGAREVIAGKPVVVIEEGAINDQTLAVKQ